MFNESCYNNFVDDISRSIFIGSILGDGYINRIRTLKGSTSMEFKYCDKYFEYLCWLHRSLLPFGVGRICSHQNSQHRFCTSNSTEMGDMRRLFYNSVGTKIVPPSIKKLLTTPLALAIWYMDDGTLDYRAKYHCNVLLATYNFTFQECKLLKEALEENFSIQSSVTKCTMRGKVYPRLYVWAKDTLHFLELVSPYVNPLKCMKHKTLRKYIP